MLTSVGRGEDFENLPVELDFKLSIKSEKSQAAVQTQTLKKVLRADRSIATPEVKPKWQNTGKFDLGKLMRRSGAVYWVKEKQKGVSLRGYKDSEKYTELLDLEFLGSFQEYSQVTVVSTADPYSQVAPGVIKFLPRSNQDNQLSPVVYSQPFPITALVSAQMQVEGEPDKLLVIFSSRYPWSLSLMLLTDLNQIQSLTLPPIDDLPIECRSLKYESQLLFCGQKNSDIKVYTVLLIDGKVTLSNNFSLIEDVEKYELVKTATTVEFIYIHRLELGISRKVIQLEGGAISEPTKLIPATRTTFEWLSCLKDPKAVEGSQLVKCAFGGAGSEIFWGNYDASSSEASFVQVGKGLRLTKSNSRAIEGFYGEENILVVIEDTDTDGFMIVQSLRLDSNSELKETNHTVDLFTERSAIDKGSFTCRVLRMYSRNSEDFVLIEERQKGKDQSQVFERKITNWILEAQGSDYNSVKDTELEFLMDFDSKETDTYKIAEIFDP